MEIIKSTIPARPSPSKNTDIKTLKIKTQRHTQLEVLCKENSNISLYCHSRLFYYFLNTKSYA